MQRCGKLSLFGALYAVISSWTLWFVLSGLFLAFLRYGADSPTSTPAMIFSALVVGYVLASRIITWTSLQKIRG